MVENPEAQQGAGYKNTATLVNDKFHKKLVPVTAFQ